jgi:hypothetical protein
MKNADAKEGSRRWQSSVAGVGRLFTAIAMMAACFCSPRGTTAQAVYAGESNRLLIFAGAEVSGDSLQYGERRMMGVTGFAEVDSRRRFGLEAEVNRVQLFAEEDETAFTYLAGPRYRFVLGRFQPWMKALAGMGEFNFPAYTRLPSRSNLVIAPGGGLDYRLNRRIRLRIVDFEYQMWPGFSTAPASAMSVRTGIRIRLR